METETAEFIYQWTNFVFLVAGVCWLFSMCRGPLLYLHQTFCSFNGAWAL